MAEIGHMRALLGEMQRLSAAGAPTKLQGFGLAKVWNEGLGYVGARYVREKCRDLLAFGDARVPYNLKKSLEALFFALGLAQYGQNEVISRDNAEAARQEDRQRARVQSIYTKYTEMLPELRKVVNGLVTTTGLDWEQARAELSKQTQQPSQISGFKGGDKVGDAFAVALSAFLTAIHLYLNKNIKNESTTWTDEIAPAVEMPKQQDPPAYVPTDEEKARVTEVADRLLKLRIMLQGYYKKPLKWDPENCFVSMIFECSVKFWKCDGGNGFAASDWRRRDWLTYEEELKMIQENPASYLKPDPVIWKLERASWHPKIQYNADLVREFDETCRLVHLWFGDPDWQSKMTRKQAILGYDFRSTVPDCLFWLSELLPKDSLFEEPDIIQKNDAFRKALRSCVDLFYVGNKPKDLGPEVTMRLINRCNLEGLERALQESTFSKDIGNKLKALKDYITSYLQSPPFIESTVVRILTGTEDMFADIQTLTSASRVKSLKNEFVEAYGDSDKKEDAEKAFTLIIDFVSQIKKRPDDDSKNLIAFVVQFCLKLRGKLGRCPPGRTLDSWIKQNLKNDYIPLKEQYMQNPVVKLVRAYCVAVETLCNVGNWGVENDKDYEENKRVEAYTRRFDGILSWTNGYLSGLDQNPARKDIEAIMKTISSLRTELERDKYKGVDKKRVETLMEGCRVALKAYVDYAYPETHE